MAHEQERDEERQECLHAPHYARVVGRMQLAYASCTKKG